jgi:hypothetical protein
MARSGGGAMSVAEDGDGGPSLGNEDKEQQAEEDFEEEIAARDFEYGALWPSSWRFRAEHLKWAAERLYIFIYQASCRDHARAVDEFREELSGKRPRSGSRELTHAETVDMFDKQMTSVYLSLVGSAIENLLKGILMAQHPESLTKQGRGRNQNRWQINAVKSHDLWKLFVRCKLSAKSDEEEVLNILSDYVVWGGRYPIPLTQDAMSRKKGGPGSFGALITSGHERHIDQWQHNLDGVYNSLFEELVKKGNYPANWLNSRLL